MRDKVSQKARAVRQVFPPTEIVIRIEWHPLFHLAEPAHAAVPVDILCGCPVLKAVIPLALRVVAHVGALRQHQRPQLAISDQLSRLGKVAAAGDLRADLHLLARALDCIIQFKRLVEVTCHRLLHVNVLA